MATSWSFASWMSRHGYPGYSESFAKKVYNRILETGESMAFAVEMCANWDD